MSGLQKQLVAVAAKHNASEHIAIFWNFETGGKLADCRQI
jgi:hypothetical protein